jgi:filamentous hemagglutinin family protein
MQAVMGVLASVVLSGGMSTLTHAQQAPPSATQLPVVNAVARGQVNITQTNTANTSAMNVNQASQSAVINWNTFNVGQSAQVNFNQPNSSAVTLNRVLDNNPSQVWGRITAPGQVFISNANGVYFSPTSSVDVGALTATSHNISDDDFPRRAS